jgi:hypothetical protein
MKFEFEIVSDFKFNQSPSSGSRVFPSGQTDGQTDMTKLIVSFRNFALNVVDCSILGLVKYKVLFACYGTLLVRGG